jgi:hypothetical protein
VHETSSLTQGEDHDVNSTYIVDAEVAQKEEELIVEAEVRHI